MDHFDFLTLDDDFQPRPRPARPPVAQLLSREPTQGQTVAVASDESLGHDSGSPSLSW